MSLFILLNRVSCATLFFILTLLLVDGWSWKILNVALASDALPSIG